MAVCVETISRCKLFSRGIVSCWVFHAFFSTLSPFFFLFPPAIRHRGWPERTVWRQDRTSRLGDFFLLLVPRQQERSPRGVRIHQQTINPTGLFSMLSAGEAVLGDSGWIQQPGLGGAAVKGTSRGRREEIALLATRLHSQEACLRLSALPSGILSSVYVPTIVCFDAGADEFAAISCNHYVSTTQAPRTSQADIGRGRR